MAKQAAAVSSIVASVAHNLRALRRQRGLSLATLAHLASVSKATVANLELSRGNPTVETLYALSDALGVPFGDLLSDAMEPVGEVVRASEGLRVAGAIDARMVSRIYGFAVAEVLEIVCPAERVREAAPHAAGVVEHLFVTRGSLRTGPSNATVELETGDFLRFAGDRPHVYESLGDEARAITITTYPASVGTALTGTRHDESANSQTTGAG